MQKKVFIVHGWEGHPQGDWYPWLKTELEKKGFIVAVPTLPETSTPRIENWVPFLTQAVKQPDENTYFVAHSMGCQTVARYAQDLPENVKIGGVVFVAGFFKRLTALDAPDQQEIIRPWLEAPINLSIVNEHINKSVAIFSDNDPWVPLDNRQDFEEKLHATIIVEHNKGHFIEEDGVRELPSALNALLQITK